MHPLQLRIKEDMEANNGKISPVLVDEIAHEAEVVYVHPTANTRICVLRLQSGHEVVGIAQVLDAKNDVESIGNQIAYNRAKDQIWSVLGNIAKLW